MSTKDKINTAVIGAGFIGKIHMEQFGAHPNAALAGVYDPLTEAAEAAAKRYGAEKVYKSEDDLIGDPAVDAVVVGAPNKLHHPLAKAALEAGKHVLLEKPPALNAAEAVDLVKLQRKHKKTLMIAHQMRWIWQNREVHRLTEEDAFGKIYYAKAGMFRVCNIPGWGSWFTRKAESGGGPLIDIGVHVLDLVLFLMGNPKPVSVFGSVYSEFGPQKKGLGSWGTPDFSGYFDVEDLASAMIRMEDGSTLTLEVSWAAHTEPDSSYSIRLMGKEGGATLDGKGARLAGQHFGKTFSVPLDPPADAGDPRYLLADHFVECVLEGRTPVSDGYSGAVNMLILDAIYKSAESGKQADIDWSLLD